MIVVSDTSPIRTLHFLDLLHLLGDLFEDVLVPPAVARELGEPLPRFEPVDLSRYSFVRIQAPSNQEQIAQFLNVLDRAESEALALAIETGTQIILIDERKGRTVAGEHHIVALGTLGILLQAKNRGLIPYIKPHIEKLFGLEFFMSNELRDSVLKLAGE